MRIAVTESTPAVATLHGELDIATIEAVRETLFSLARDPRQLIVDLTGVTFCGWAGVRMLLEFQREVAEPGQTVLAGCSRGLLRVMDIADVRALFDLADTVDEARGHLLTRVPC
jgi:anti-sigma B factor antagonist